jgi:hypothetical protein
MNLGLVCTRQKDAELYQKIQAVGKTEIKRKLRISTPEDIQ